MDEYYKLISLDEELEIIQYRKIKNIKEFISKKLKKELFLSNEFINEKIKQDIIGVEEEKEGEEEIENFYLEQELIFLKSSLGYKNMVQQQVTEQLELYQILYSLPNIKIADKDWDILFDVMHDFYEKKDIKNYFLYDMHKLNRFSIANCLLDKSESLNINTYINSLEYLKSDNLLKEELEEVKKDLISKTKENQKIISFSKYKSKNLKNR